MHLAVFTRLIALEPNASRLCAHLLASHTATPRQVPRRWCRATASRAALTDALRHDAVAPCYTGEIVAGRDLRVL
jgi:hypothetical protein